MIKAPKGTRDVLPQESYKWHYIEQAIRDTCAKYCYRETRTPVFEHTELFLRGVGDTTDIVQKEMYTFTDKGERLVTLKPEGTAGCVRAYLEHSLYAAVKPTKLYYLYCPVFRYENPQAGRLREHHQFGVEVFGAPGPSVDAEVILIALELFARLGVTGLELNINSIGCPKCRPAYNEALRRYFEARKDSLCGDCLLRLARNPLRLLDCKKEKCGELGAGAPKMIDYLCEECAAHFNGLKARLSRLGVPFNINPFIVRGLDYYTKTVFEIISAGIGAQGTVCGGGRYDGLVGQLGGPDTPGIGFGLGLERLLLVMESQGVEIPDPGLLDAFVCTMGENAAIAGFELLQELRGEGVRADCDHVGKSLKAQFKYADKAGASIAIVIGESELEAGAYVVRDMVSGEETRKTKAEIMAGAKAWACNGKAKF